MTEKPEDIIGRAAVRALLDAGYRIVPKHPTQAMLRAAAEAMAVRQRQMGDKWWYVSNTQKAAIRWGAMLGRWHLDHNIPKPWKRWTIGKWFVLEIDRR